MSATYCTRPVTFSGPSGRGIDRPTPLTSRVVFMVDMSGAPGGLRGLGDRGDHLRVARAAAEIARDAVADLLFARLRILGEERGGGHEDARDAVAALGHAEPDEGVLERVQDAVLTETLDGRHGAPARLHCQHEAARHRLAVEVHGAGAAVPRATTFFGSGEAEVLAKRIEQRLIRLHQHLDGLAVDRGAQDLFRHGQSPPEDQAPARASAVVSVRRVRTRTRWRRKSAEPRWSLTGFALWAARSAACAISCGVRALPSSAASALVARTGVGATAARAIRAFEQTPFESVTCDATPTTAMSSSRRGVWRM